MGSQRTKEDDVQRISTSVFITNFPEYECAKDLWNACKQYGYVVDAFIPNRRSKAGKKFRFVRFIKVFDVERLVNNLCTVWIGRHRIHVNVAKFHRPTGLNRSKLSNQNGEYRDTSNGVKQDSGNRDNTKSYAYAVKGRVQENGERDTNPSVSKFESGLENEGFTDIDLRYLGGLWVMIVFKSVKTLDFDEHNDEDSDSDDEQFEGVFKEDIGGSNEEVQGENDVSVVPDTVVEETNPKSIDGDGSSDQIGKQSADPFNIYSLLNKNKLKENKESNTNESLKYPPGFTPSEDVEANGQMDNQRMSFDCEKGNERNVSDEMNSNVRYNRSKKEGMEYVSSGHFKKSEVPRTGGSLLTVMEELIKVGQTMGYNMEGCLNPKAKKDWVKELCVSNKVNFLTLQETKMESITLFDIKKCWGNFVFDFVHSDSVGNSGGILCVWDPNSFKKLNTTISDYFVMIRGNWVNNGKLLLIISVYAPQEFSEKKLLWDYLGQVIANWKGEVIIMGDFNEVRNKNERFGSIFHVQGANAFNTFISMANLEEIPLGGCSFTWCHRSASKMSKLDRFLMSESLLRECPNFSAITLDRYLSDHHPILLRESTQKFSGCWRPSVH
ncbi:RNA-directed DNA polymerase, eukaryota, reverse transcriptase zinc-binding domain protein [Tanacetum coccineum]